MIWKLYHNFYTQNCYNFIRYIAWILVYHMRPAMIFNFCLFLDWFVWYKNKQCQIFFNKLICGGISFCKPLYCSISQLEAQEYFGLCGNKASFETMMCVNFFWTAPSCIIGELLLVVKDRALNATVDFRGLWLHIQKDAQIRGASAGVSLDEIQRRVFEKYAFCISCLGYQDKAISLILLVLPYTILTRALNCLFVLSYMKMLRHYLIDTKKNLIPKGKGYDPIWPPVPTSRGTNQPKRYYQGRKPIKQNMHCFNIGYQKCWVPHSIVVPMIVSEDQGCGIDSRHVG